MVVQYRQHVKVLSVRQLSPTTNSNTPLMHAALFHDLPRLIVSFTDAFFLHCYLCIALRSHPRPSDEHPLVNHDEDPSREILSSHLSSVGPCLLVQCRHNKQTDKNTATPKHNTQIPHHVPTALPEARRKAAALPWHSILASSRKVSSTTTVTSRSTLATITTISMLLSPRSTDFCVNVVLTGTANGTSTSRNLTIIAYRAVTT